MSYHELMKLSGDAAKRAREAIAAEKARGGPGAHARAMAAAAPALDEIKVISNEIGRYRKIEDSIEDRNGRLRRLRQDDVRPPDVKRRQAAQLQAEIEELKTARRDWEREVRATLLPASMEGDLPPVYYRDIAPGRRIDSQPEPNEKPVKQGDMPVAPPMKPSPDSRKPDLPRLPRAKPEGFADKLPDERQALTDDERSDTADELRRSDEPGAGTVAGKLEEMWQSGSRALERAADELVESWESGKASAEELASEAEAWLSDAWDEVGELAGKAAEWIVGDDAPVERLPVKRRPEPPLDAKPEKWTADFPRPRPRPTPAPLPRIKPLPPKRAAPYSMDFHPGTEGKNLADIPYMTDQRSPPFRMTSPVEGYPKVRNDPQSGRGSFWSRRTNSKIGKTYGHRGIDILAKPGEPIRAPVGGYITKIGSPYGSEGNKGSLRYIEIRMPDGYNIRLLYVSPKDVHGDNLVAKGQWVDAGQVIGSMQDRAKFSSGMTNHVHMEVWHGHKDAGGRPMDPTVWIREWQAESQRERRFFR